jgi:hypothetical protein
MQYQKDAEILDLKRRAKSDYRDCANAIGIAPTLCSQRVLGFIRWQGNERERLRRFLVAQITEHEQVAPVK